MGDCCGADEETGVWEFMLLAIPCCWDGMLDGSVVGAAIEPEAENGGRLLLSSYGGGGSP